MSSGGRGIDSASCFLADFAFRFGEGLLEGLLGGIRERDWEKQLYVKVMILLEI